MICKFCGNVIDDNSDFCFICGQQVSGSSFSQNDDVFSQPAAAPASTPVYSQEPFAAPVQPATTYAQEPYVAPVQPAPVYAQDAQAAPEQAPKKKGKKGSSEVTKAKKFFAAFFAATFFFQWISWLWVRKATKQGYEQKAAELANSTMIGLCVFMGIVSVIIVFKYMLS